MAFNEIEISQQPLTNIRRKVRRFQTITHEDGELTIVVKVIFLDNDGNDLIETFRGMIGNEITKEQFDALERKYSAYQVSHSTRNSWIDPLTGDLVAAGTEGAIPEIEWLRGLKVDDDLQPLLSGLGYIAADEERHIVIEEAFEKWVMQRMDTLKRY